MAAKSAAVLERLGSELSFKRMDLSGTIVFWSQYVTDCIMCGFKIPRYDKLEKFPRTRLLIINHWSPRDG